MIDIHYPQHSLLSFFKNHPVIFPRIVKPRSLVGAQTVFTDSSPQGNAVVVSQGLVSQTPVGNVSVQAAKITARILAL